MSKETNYSGGVTFVGLLTIVFIVLKLCGVITWSWWWVTCPMWGIFALVFVVLIVVGLLKLGVWVSECVKRRKK